MVLRVVSKEAKALPGPYSLLQYYDITRKATPKINNRK